MVEEEDLYACGPSRVESFVSLVNKYCLLKAGSRVAGRIWEGHASRQVCVLGRRRDITSSR